MAWLGIVALLLTYFLAGGFLWRARWDGERFSWRFGLLAVAIFGSISLLAGWVTYLILY